MEVRTQLIPADDNTGAELHVPYKEIIGSLMYTVTATRPNITFAVLALAQFMHWPTRMHWEAAKHVIRYLKGMKNLELTYGATTTGIIRYSDANHASQYHHHSISGYAFLMNGGVVSWSSKKQPLVMLSTTEVEYIAAAHATKEALWLREFLGEVVRPLSAPTMLNCNNQATIALSKDGQFHAQTKHIDLWFHFIHEAVTDGTVTLTYCPTQVMMADILTKLLNCRKTGELAGSLGLLPP